MRRQAFKRIERALSQDALTTTPDVSSRMALVRQIGTSPELVVRRALSSIGARYTTGNRDLPGSPDLANRSRRWAVFVHGCYWHRHRGCKKATNPKTNVAFWSAKFTRNIERDRIAVAALRERGFTVLTIWECETNDDGRLCHRLAKLGTTSSASSRL
jgi:DNA mismatch endonuclease, patch repair protein